MAFYAIWSKYGAACWGDSGKRTGRVLRFDKKADRNNWVNDDRWDGNFHRFAITRDEARYNFPEAFQTGYRSPYASNWPYMWETIDPDDYETRFLGNVPANTAWSL